MESAPCCNLLKTVIQTSCGSCLIVVCVEAPLLALTWQKKSPHLLKSTHSFYNSYKNRNPIVATVFISSLLIYSTWAEQTNFYSIKSRLLGYVMGRSVCCVVWFVGGFKHQASNDGNLNWYLTVSVVFKAINDNSDMNKAELGQKLKEHKPFLFF